VDEASAFPGLQGGCVTVEMQIGSAVDKYFVNGVDMDVLCRDIFQIHRIDPGGDTLVLCHPGNGNFVADLRAVLFLVPADGLFCHKEPGAAWNSDGFQGGTDCEADRLVGAGRVCDQEICPERVVSAMDALDRCVKGFHVYGNVDIFSRDAGLTLFIHGLLPIADAQTAIPEMDTAMEPKNAAKLNINFLLVRFFSMSFFILLTSFFNPPNTESDDCLARE
jgi:hypothetical protein